MTCLHIDQVKDFFNCLERIERGERVVVCHGMKPVAELFPLQNQKTKRRRPIGLARKEHPGFVIDEQFFKPLPEELVAAFSGESQ